MGGRRSRITTKKKERVQGRSKDRQRRRRVRKSKDSTKVESYKTSFVCVCVRATDVWHLDLFIGTGSGTESNPTKPGSTTPTTRLHTETNTILVSLTLLVLYNFIPNHTCQKLNTIASNTKHISKVKPAPGKSFYLNHSSEKKLQHETMNS